MFCTNNDIELKSFTNVAIDERTESKAKESNSKTEEEKKISRDKLPIFPTDNLVKIKRVENLYI